MINSFPTMRSKFLATITMLAICTALFSQSYQGILISSETRYVAPDFNIQQNASLGVSFKANSLTLDLKPLGMIVAEDVSYYASLDIRVHIFSPKHWQRRRTKKSPNWNWQWKNN